MCAVAIGIAVLVFCFVSGARLVPKSFAPSDRPFKGNGQ